MPQLQRPHFPDEYVLPFKAEFDRVGQVASGVSSHSCSCSAQTAPVCCAVLWATTARTGTNACVSAATSAVSPAPAVTACSVPPVKLDSSNRGPAVWSVVQTGLAKAEMLKC